MKKSRATEEGPGNGSNDRRKIQKESDTFYIIDGPGENRTVERINHKLE